MSDNTETKTRKTVPAFYKVKNDVTGEELIVKATSASVAEAYSRNEALKKVASFTTEKLDADGITALVESGVDIKDIKFIEASSKAKGNGKGKADATAAPDAAPVANASPELKPAAPAAPAASPVFSASTFAR